MTDDAARSEHYATQAVLGAAMRLLAAIDAERGDPDEMGSAEAGLREAVRLWKHATSGQVVVTEPPVHAVTVRPGDTLVVAFPDSGSDADATGVFDALRMMRRSLPDVELVLFGGTIHGRTRPDAPADEPAGVQHLTAAEAWWWAHGRPDAPADELGPMPRLEDVERHDPGFPRG